MSERDEMAAENAKQEEKVNEVRSEMQRMAAGCRSAYLIGVTPRGEMVSLCFYAGYADTRAMQVESMDRFREVIAHNSKRAPSQIV